MKANPFFSVILPTFNRAAQISNAIESVLTQSYNNWELIIIDDGSTDNTEQIVRSYVDDKIIYLYQENAERSAARNKGIELASGSYICFVDSDDFYFPDHLKFLLEFLSTHNFPEAIVYTGAYNESNEIISVPEQLYYTSSNALEHVVLNIIGTPQVCIHRNILLKYKFRNDLNVGEDMELWLRILLEYPLFYTEKITLGIGIHEGRTVNVKKGNVYKKTLASFRISISDKRIRLKIRKKIRYGFISDCYLGMAKFYLYKKSRIMAAILIIFSIIINPSTQLKYKINIIYNLFLNFEKALILVG